ncbi:bile acid:sodium symporter family protein [Shimia ponticola]|uniref:bile acid:sodium symporter family protein n=1 Tax=Shimia ponticola TaxID=2582893 RepID=UPI0011BDFA74|nr:bile acid:sodium symporter family protein [Shimia ponticola]
MELLLTVGLPLSLAFIMFSLGVGLTFADFARVATRPKAFLIGAVAQLILLPLTAFALLHILPLQGALAVGVMILAFCPGGVTSNLLTRLANGSVALSISLTAVISLTTAFTLPLLLDFSADYFEGTSAPDIDVTTLSLTMFAITAVPVLIGVLFRRFLNATALAIETLLYRIAAALFVIIILAALAANWSLFIDNLATMGPLLIGLNIVMLGLGVGLARAAGLDSAESAAIAIEAGVQNGTLGITVASLITTTALSPYGLASGVYGITMYLVTIPAIFLFLRRQPAKPAS